LPAVLQATKRVKARATDGDGLVLEVQQSDRQKWENMLARRIEEAELPAPVRQYLWARPERLYRADFAYPDDHLLLEVQGGIWARDPGRHNRGSGYEADLERSNLAVLLGWRLLAFSERMIRSGQAVETIKRALTPALHGRHENEISDDNRIEEQQCLPA
jgi:very-short-patch-repair endonuclease